VERVHRNDSSCKREQALSFTLDLSTGEGRSDNDAPVIYDWSERFDAGITGFTVSTLTSASSSGIAPGDWEQANASLFAQCARISGSKSLQTFSKEPSFIASGPYKYLIGSGSQYLAIDKAWEANSGTCSITGRFSVVESVSGTPSTNLSLTNLAESESKFTISTSNSQLDMIDHTVSMLVLGPNYQFVKKDIVVRPLSLCVSD